jgi:hypothetical protein
MRTAAHRIETLPALEAKILVGIGESLMDQSYLQTQHFYDEPCLGFSWRKAGPVIIFHKRQALRSRRFLIFVLPNSWACQGSIAGDFSNLADICFSSCGLKGTPTDDSTIFMICNATTTKSLVCLLTQCQIRSLSSSSSYEAALGIKDKSIGPNHTTSRCASSHVRATCVAHTGQQ